MHLPRSNNKGGDSERISYGELLGLADERIMRELQAGNADAFAVVFKRYHRLVHVTALHILRDAGEAEDLTQTVFLEIYRNAGQYDTERGTLKVWLLQYAYSRSMNRRNYLMVRQFHNQTSVDAIEESGSIWSPVQLSAQESVQLTSEILAILPEAQRRTLEMFFFQGLTLKEIAERSQETFSNVRHHYYRGLERLRSYLEEGGQEDRKRSLRAPVEARRAET